MFLSTYKVIGILGGMGPEATIDLYNHIISLTPALKDQDHIPTLIFSNPKIPDRTASINSELAKVVIDYLCEGAVILERGGADCILIPCNTAHIYYDEIQNAVKVPVLNMIYETLQYITEHYPDIKRAGLLATSGTVKMQLYQRFLENNSIQTYVPSETVQKEYVTKAIYDIKAGKSLDDAEILLKKAIASLDSLPPQIIIMGCTEIPLALRKPIEGCVFINPTRILAGCAVRLCMNII